MREAYIKAIANNIRNQAGHLADFVETNPERTQKEDLYANIFLAFTGIFGAILYLDITIYDFYDILTRLFREETGFKIIAKLEEWEENYRQGHKCP